MYNYVFKRYGRCISLHSSYVQLKTLAITYRTESRRFQREQIDRGLWYPWNKTAVQPHILLFASSILNLEMKMLETSEHRLK